jgi:ubiquinone/menaquinone biosynthesis C-methylase UbiE
VSEGSPADPGAMAEPTDALGRARALLREDVAAAAEASTASGYLDLLDGVDLQSTGRAQDLMTTSLVPRIYERYWRPALGRALKGVTGPSMAEEVRIARLLMGLSPGDVALDVACGPGNFTREFARVVGADGLVVGIDGSRTMLERGAAELARSGQDNVALIRGDATDLPFRDDRFDAVCCFAALHLFAEPVRALEQMRRVLKDGGRIAIMTSARRGVVPTILRPAIEGASGMRLFDADEVVTALEERGFTDVQRRLNGMVQFVGGRLAAR